MRKIPFLTIILTLLVAISLGLSYLLIYNSNPILKYLSTENQDKTSMTDNKEQLNSYYQPSKPEIEEVIYPTSLIYANGGQIYNVNHYPTLQNIMVNFENAPFEMDEVQVTKDKIRYDMLYEAEYIELDYNQPVPITLLDKIIINRNNNETDFKANRIVIPRGSGDVAYAVDTNSKSFVELIINRDLKSEELFDQVSKVKNQWQKVQSYELRNGSVYLPVAKQKILSQVYTLEKIPENLFISSVFPNSDFVISQANTNEVKSYQNYQSTLTFYGNKQLLSITTNSVAKGEDLSDAQRIIESFGPVRQHAYWHQGVRYDGVANHTVTYRRYLNGLPIYSNRAIDDYGAIKVFMRDTPGAEVYRFEKPTVVLQSNVDDYSSQVEVQSADQIIAGIQEAGFGLEQFDRVRLAYEWQADMQNFQVVTLIPKWYFQFDGRSYSFDEIVSGRLADELTGALDEETTQEGGN